MMIVLVAQPHLCLLRYITATHTGVEAKVNKQLYMFYPELANIYNIYKTLKLYQTRVRRTP
jgi:hypothetical protein